METCSECGTTVIETTGEARRGGGYHRRCENGHEWDDPKWSYFKDEQQRRGSGTDG